VEFCAEVKSWADALFAAHPEWPFGQALIEHSGVGNRKRQDLRICRRDSPAPLLCGEVKMPGTIEGRTPYHPALMQDAFSKADDVQSPYFFTWNVNTFVLFDRSRWQVPMLDRRVRDWDLGLRLHSAADCGRPEVQSQIRERFLPALFGEFAEIVAGRRVDWGLPPDALFIHSLESHLDWPVAGTADYLATQAQSDPAFATRLQAWMAGEMAWTFDPDDPEAWRAILDRAARTLCYTFANRAIFYDALRAKYPDRLRRLSIPRDSTRGHQVLYESFRADFRRAVRESGDYEPILYPEVDDRVGALVFASSQALDGWRGVFENLDQYDFRTIPHDIIGGIFQRLIAPEERQKFGQYYTGEDIVDLINAFCIRRADDRVLDPACGSGSFLVRAYHRKAWLGAQRQGTPRHRDSHLSHQELLQGIYGCDIGLFAAHLATLNLASRHIEEEENYPYIARGNFFEVVERHDAFCHVPGALRAPDGSRVREPVPLPELDAIVGNPPYVRQEGIERRSTLKRRPGESLPAFASRQRNTKEHFHELCSRLWPGLKLSGRSDLHCYFWPVAAGLLREGGHFGFLTSSSWLDVEYGFALQRWVLQHFRLLAVIESLDEPWFPDARVKTAIAILERCSDAAAREANLVRFVRFLKPVRDLLGERPLRDEGARQAGPEALRQRILGTKGPAPGETMAQVATADWRIVTVRQTDLWKEGLRAWELLRQEAAPPAVEDDEASREDESGFELSATTPDYAAGKWGRFLRAPDIYFRLVRDYGHRFVRLGEIAEVRRGITSGCDAFFMPHDVTSEVLAKVSKGLPWNDVGLMADCPPEAVESGRLRLIRAGDGTLHPIEAEFIRPEVHSLMQVDRPVIRAADCSRVVLWVRQDLPEIGGTYAVKYIRWGARQTFASKKSKAVRVPERSTCAARERWYDLTTDRMGVVFWPKAQKYRHIIPANPDGLACNCNLYTVIPQLADDRERTALAALLNSTVVALMKCFFGRYAGTEGTLKTEVVDTVLLEVPDPRVVSPRLAVRLESALASISRRDVTHLVEERMLQCHSAERMREILETPAQLCRELQQDDRRELDDAVLELLGVADHHDRHQLLGQLYRETAEYYRYQRTQDIQTMENRAGQGRSQIGPEDLAASIWDSLTEEPPGRPVAAWITAEYPGASPVDIPDGQARVLGAEDLFDPAAVTFRQGGTSLKRTYANPAQAALVGALADLDVRGQVALPVSPRDCERCLADLRSRLVAAQARFAELAATRTGQAPMQEKVSAILMQWFIHARE